MAIRKTKGWNVVESLFSELEKNGANTITELSKKTGFNHKTIRNYIRMIELIQSKPKLIVITTGSSYQISLDK